MNNEKATFFLLTVLAFLFFVIFAWGAFFSHDLNSDLTNYSLAGFLIVQGILMIWMIRDCIKRPFDKNSTLINWIVIIVFFGFFGTTVYYLQVKNKMRE